jgi:cell division septation protein DedD
VQIGAYRSEAAVQERWRSLLGRLGGPLDGIRVRAEAVSPALGAMKRALVGPFASKLDARAFCAKALQVKSACFVR